MIAQQAARRSAPGARAIAEGALLADLTVLVVLIGLYVPFAGPALAAISPIPLLLLVLRQGWRVTVEAAIAAALLITFLTGPFSAFGVLIIALRAAALGIGLRHGWPVRKTVLAGTVFLWVIVWAGVTLVALTLPSWRAATEQGLILTYHQVTGLAAIVLKIVGLGGLWTRVRTPVNDFLPWFIHHWLQLLPVVSLPVLLVAVAAEYVIVEVTLPRFGVHPPPLRFPWAGGGGRPPGGGTGLRGRLELVLEARLTERQDRMQAREQSRLTPATVPVRTADGRVATGGDERTVALSMATEESPHL